MCLNTFYLPSLGEIVGIITATSPITFTVTVPLPLFQHPRIFFVLKARDSCLVFLLNKYWMYLTFWKGFFKLFTKKRPIFLLETPTSFFMFSDEKFHLSFLYFVSGWNMPYPKISPYPFLAKKHIFWPKNCICFVNPIIMSMRHFLLYALHNIFPIRPLQY